MMRRGPEKNQLLTLSQERYETIKSSIAKTTGLVKDLQSWPAFVNGLLWISQQDTILFGMVDSGLTRREKFRELHKVDGTGTTTKPPPKVD